MGTARRNAAEGFTPGGGRITKETTTAVTMSRPLTPRRHTVQDYLAWPDDVRCELIDGQVFDMTPAPSLDHQDVALALASAFREAASAKGRTGGGGSRRSGCEVFVSPVDVVLSEDTVVQPDVVVVCDPGKTADRRRIQGPPDLVVEVLSPSTSIKDRREKRRLYEAHGVPEYLIVDPDEHYAEYFQLGQDGRYLPSAILGPEDGLGLACLRDVSATLSEMLGWTLSSVQDAPARYAR